MHRERPAHREVRIEGYTADEILSLPVEWIQQLAVTGEPGISARLRMCSRPIMPAPIRPNLSVSAMASRQHADG